ncbi:prepilin-type N-terminal cleavage/methylation domain-containing protein [Thermosynechococcus sp. FA-CM-4201]
MSRQAKNGFTLVEILVSLIVASIIIVSLGSLLIEMLRVESRESSLNQIRQDLQASIEYITSDLEQAYYVFTANDLANPNKRDPLDQFQTSDILTSFGSVTLQPILAMVKLEPISREIISNSFNNCSPSDTLCNQIYNTRSVPLLVVYYLDDNPNSKWPGKARLRRYQRTVNGLISSMNSSTDQLPPVVMDFIDQNWSSLPATPVPCEPGFQRTPSTGSNSFYACVSTASSTGINATTLVYLRANPEGLPGINSSDIANRPVMTTTVRSRSIVVQTSGSGG